MKTYKIIIYGKEIDILQDEEGYFIKPVIVKELEQFGTALKPAFEPICMAMKPLAEKTVAENVLKYGTGGINIDESRVGMSQEDKEMLDAKASTTDNGVNFDVGESKAKGTATPANNLGRFPANLIHDNSEEVRECFPEQKSGARSSKHKIGNDEGQMFNHGIYGKYKAKNYDDAPADSGNASRFFKSIIYQAKASKSERNKGCEEMDEGEVKHYTKNRRCKICGYQEVSGSPCKCENPDWEIIERPVMKGGNSHPTVKPIALMEYLIKMITPKGGIVLDPFAGSGSTLVAAKKNGFQYIGIELTEEYIPIIEARLSAVKQELKLF